MSHTDVLHNPQAVREGASALSDEISRIMFPPSACAAAGAVIRQWAGYAPTPLRSLVGLAAETGVGAIHYKDESGRFGLGSFKALGGAYAVFTLLVDEIEQRTGRRPTADELARGAHRSITGGFAIASATAGNHGRSVAWGAQMFGCPCAIYIHSGVGEDRAQAIARYGAKLVRVAGDYDESVRVAAADAAEHGWTVVSDTSYPGYMEIPRRVMLGYTVMMDEVAHALERPPTHVLVPAGVGGLAAAVAAHALFTWGDSRPRFIVVEPELSDCLFQSARQGRLARARGPLGSQLLGLDCGDPSPIAWEVLSRLADDFVLISDAAALSAMRRLNRIPAEDGTTIEAGECAGAGLTVLLEAAQRPALAASLGLGRDSRVLLIGTEGHTDPEACRRILRPDAAVAS